MAEDARAGSLSERFFALTPERILGAVEIGGRRATGWAFAHGSLENRVYEVELEDGGRVVAKFYRPGRWSREAILDEHLFLAELAEAEVPVVAPLDLEGTTLRELAVDGGGIFYALFPKARGRAPEDLDDEQLRRLGRLIARLHLTGQVHTAPARPALTAESYGAASVRKLLDGPTIPIELQPGFRRAGEALVGACARALVGQEERHVRLHGDCHPGNLLWGSEGPFFLDFDDFLAGPAAQDLWLLAPGRDADADRQRALLVEGYRTLRDFDPRTLRLVEPLRALRILRYAAWVAERYRDPAFQRAFPDFLEHSHWQRETAALEEQLPRVQAA